MTDSAVLCRELTKHYMAPHGHVEVKALRGLDLDIKVGERIAITGPSGCGKSSLLNILGALDRPSGGSIEVLGQDLESLDNRARALYRRNSISFVFQQFHLIPSLTAFENVTLPLHYAGVSSAAQQERAKQALERVSLGHRGFHFPAMLSGGEQQRVAVARALVTGAPLVLADEPTGNLDGETASSIMSLLQECLGPKRTLLIVTHDPEVADLMERRISLRDGRVEQDRKV